MPGFLSLEPVDPNRIEELRIQLAAEGTHVIDLTDSNPTSHGLIYPAEQLLAQVERYLSKRVYRPDPQGLMEAREAICRYYYQRTPPLNIAPENVFITASTSESYRLLFSLLCDPWDEVLSPSITYPLFDLLSADQRVALKTYDLKYHHDKWSIDFDHLQSLIKPRTRGVLIVSPHNPTGHVLRGVPHPLYDPALPLIVDEVFAEFSWDGSPVPPAPVLAPELPVFLLNGISKMFALPDLKLGWIVLSDMALRPHRERLQILNDTYLSATQLSQSLLPYLLDHREEFLSPSRETYRCRLQLASQLLTNCSRLKPLKPEGGWALIVAVDTGVEEEELVLNLLRAGVYVHPGYFYGLSGRCHIVISCIPSEPVLIEGIARITRYLAESPL